MTPAPATHAVVTIPALDLRPRPDHRAELGSQLLMGETVRMLAGARAGWRRVRGEADGYEGWVRTWGLVPAGASRARRWRRAATARVSATVLPMAARPGSGIAVGPLFLSSRVIPGRRSGARRQVELPDGRRGWVEASGLLSDRGKVPSLLERVSSLLGVPYLWGGRTPAGLDCSAFVQLVLGEQGVRLPRDARQQHAACRALAPRSGPREGDLAFFAAAGQPPGHVGLALGDGYFAHARALVRISSVEQGNALYDKELMPQFRGWYRPRGRATAGD